LIDGYMGTYTSSCLLEVWLDGDGVEDVSELDEDDEVLESKVLSEILWERLLPPLVFEASASEMPSSLWSSVEIFNYSPASSVANSWTSSASSITF